MKTSNTPQGDSKAEKASTTDQARLQAYGREQRELRAEKDELLTRRKPINERLAQVNQRLRDISHAIYDLKGGPDAPSITDHAVVRYLEREKGIDILAIKSEIRTRKESIWKGNTIVTFMEEYK